MSLQDIKEQLVKQKVVSVSEDWVYNDERFYGIASGNNLLTLTLENGDQIELTLENYNYKTKAYLDELEARRQETKKKLIESQKR